jgi:hypothetical protein
MQSRRTERGFGWIRDVQGGAGCCHHTARPSPDHVAAAVASACRPTTDAAAIAWPMHHP